VKRRSGGILDRTHLTRNGRVRKEPIETGGSPSISRTLRPCSSLSKCRFTENVASSRVSSGHSGNSCAASAMSSFNVNARRSFSPRPTRAMTQFWLCDRDGLNPVELTSSDGTLSGARAGPPRPKPIKKGLMNLRGRPISGPAALPLCFAATRPFDLLRYFYHRFSASDRHERGVVVMLFWAARPDNRSICDRTMSRRPPH
jgi:hypothetical protein